jgi:hypothetical protein
VIVGDHQLQPAQAAIGEAAAELGPEHLGLGMGGMHAEDLALAARVHGDSHYDGAADDAAALAVLDVGGVEPEASHRDAIGSRPMASARRPKKGR